MGYGINGGELFVGGPFRPTPFPFLPIRPVRMTSARSCFAWSGKSVCSIDAIASSTGYSTRFSTGPSSVMTAYAGRGSPSRGRPTLPGLMTVVVPDLQDVLDVRVTDADVVRVDVFEPTLPELRRPAGQIRRAGRAECA